MHLPGHLAYDTLEDKFRIERKFTKYLKKVCGFGSDLINLRQVFSETHLSFRKISPIIVRLLWVSTMGRDYDLLQFNSAQSRAIWTIKSL